MVVQSDIFKDTVLENFVFKGNYAEVGGGAYVSFNKKHNTIFIFNYINWIFFISF